MTASTTFSVIVADDNGWLEGCPDYQGTFFGDLPEGALYVGPRESQFGAPGHVEFTNEVKAEAFVGRLNTTGTWMPNGGTDERRPNYEVRS